MNLITLTFCNKIDERISLLKESCKKHGHDLVILGEGEKWKSNTFKLKLIADYFEELPPSENIYLIIDAFDVVICDSPESIIKGFLDFNTQILLSSESNFFFWNQDLMYYYWRFHPRSSTSIYHYINSGTIIGHQTALKEFYKLLIDNYELDINDEESFYKIRSDQYLFSRFYIDHYFGNIGKDLSIKVDHNHKIMGCTGGRTCVYPWPKINSAQEFLFFHFERRALKTFKRKNEQEWVQDLKWDVKEKKYNNLHTGEHPMLIHMPGTYEHFKRIWVLLEQNNIKRNRNFFSVFISLIAYIKSIIYLPLISFFRNFRNENYGIVHIPDRLEVLRKRANFEKLLCDESNSKILISNSYNIRENPSYALIDYSEIQVITPSILYLIAKLNGLVITKKANKKIWSQFKINSMEPEEVVSKSPTNQLLVLSGSGSVINKTDRQALLKNNNRLLIFDFEFEKQLKNPSSVFRSFPIKRPF